MSSLFYRLESLIGEDKVAKLAQKTILIIGCGGVGGYVIEALARSNIGCFILVDYDIVEESNCNRQLIALQSTIGQYKVACWEDRILAINPACDVITYQKKLEAKTLETIFSHSIDYVIDACDDISAKKLLIKHCLNYQLPFISCMGTGNRCDPSKLCITTLDKTNYDPLARIMRHFIKEEQIKQPIVVCASTEIPIKTCDRTIASCAFVPGSAGLLISSFVIQQLMIEKKSC